LNEWHHVAGTYDLNSIKLYRDGVLVDESVIGDITPYYAPTLPLIVGRDDQVAGRYFNGLVDEVRIYSRALGPDEIAVLSGNFPVEPGETAAFTSTCSGMCSYRLNLGGIAKEAMLQC